VTPRALLALACAAEALATLAREAAEDAPPAQDEHLTLKEAARVLKLRTDRPIKDAGRAGDLPLYGNERSRTVKRGELLAWHESRRATPIAGVDDEDIQRRMSRLRSKRGKKTTTTKPGTKPLTAANPRAPG
jgi:hypothetical protein